MKILKSTLFMPIVFLLSMGLMLGGTRDAEALSKEIAPDIPREIVEKLLPDAKVYITGNGPKEVLLLADPFCENSRKTYRLLQTNVEKIRTVRILWVSRYPRKMGRRWLRPWQ